MLQNDRLKGASLLISVIIALVLALFCSSLIMLSYYVRQDQFRESTDHQLNRNLRSAIHLALADTTIFKEIKEDSLDLFQEGSDSVFMKRKLWGVLQLASIECRRGNYSKRCSFLYGSGLSDSLDGCLYLSEHQRPLVLEENVKLLGNVYASRSGIKAGSNYPTGQEINVDGLVKQSNARLPGLRTEILDEIRQTLSENVDRANKMDAGRDTGQDSLTQSFDKDPLVIHKKGIAYLENCTLSGHVLITSDSVIEVSASARLLNVVLIAPTIRIKQGFAGSGQFMATDSLIVENNCVLNYPSVLFFQKRPERAWQNKLVIGQSCTISGAIISVCEEADIHKTYAEIGTGSAIHGVVYIKGYLDIKGKVRGSVLTDFFIHKTPATIFENHISDVEMNRKDISSHFLVSVLFKGMSKKGIVQWVN